MCRHSWASKKNKEVQSNSYMIETVYERPNFATVQSHAFQDYVTSELANTIIVR